MAAAIQPDSTLDCRGMQCPMPIVKARIALKRLQPGQILEVIATDPGSMPDFAAFAVETGNTLVAQEREGDLYKHYLRKAG